MPSSRMDPIESETVLSDRDDVLHEITVGIPTFDDDVQGTGRDRYWQARSNARPISGPTDGRAPSSSRPSSAPRAGRATPGASSRRTGSGTSAVSVAERSISPQLSEPWLDENWANLAVAARWLDVLLTPAQLEFDRAKYREVLEHVEQVRGGPGSVLDVGSSLGVFLHLAQRRGWDIAGVEPGAQARARASEHFGLPLSASLAEVRGQTFDLVTFWEVVEHAEDRPGLLAAARELFEPGGTVLTLVGGNAHTLTNRVMRAASAAFDFSRLWYFSPSSYAILLEQAGLERRRSTCRCSRNSTPR